MVYVGGLEPEAAGAVEVGADEEGGVGVGVVVFVGEDREAEVVVGDAIFDEGTGGRRAGLAVVCIYEKIFEKGVMDDFGQERYMRGTDVSVRFIYQSPGKSAKGKTEQLTHPQAAAPSPHPPHPPTLAPQTIPQSRSANSDSDATSP